MQKLREAVEGKKTVGKYTSSFAFLSLNSLTSVLDHDHIKCLPSNYTPIKMLKKKSLPVVHRELKCCSLKFFCRDTDGAFTII